MCISQLFSSILTKITACLLVGGAYLYYKHRQSPIKKVQPFLREIKQKLKPYRNSKCLADEDLCTLYRNVDPIVGMIVSELQKEEDFNTKNTIITATIQSLLHPHMQSCLTLLRDHFVLR